jgi:hypothetical protein
MASTEHWYYVKDGMLWEHFENDGYAAMRRGLEAKDIPLCEIEEAKKKYPVELERAFKSGNF